MMAFIIAHSMITTSLLRYPLVIKSKFIERPDCCSMQIFGILSNTLFVHEHNDDQ